MIVDHQRLERPNLLGGGWGAVKGEGEESWSSRQRTPQHAIRAAYVAAGNLMSTASFRTAAGSLC